MSAFEFRQAHLEADFVEHDGVLDAWVEGDLAATLYLDGSTSEWPRFCP